MYDTRVTDFEWSQISQTLRCCPCFIRWVRSDECARFLCPNIKEPKVRHGVVSCSAVNSRPTFGVECRYFQVACTASTIRRNGQEFPDRRWPTRRPAYMRYLYMPGRSQFAFGAIRTNNRDRNRRLTLSLTSPKKRPVTSLAVPRQATLVETMPMAIDFSAFMKPPILMRSGFGAGTVLGARTIIRHLGNFKLVDRHGKILRKLRSGEIHITNWTF